MSWIRLILMASLLGMPLLAEAVDRYISPSGSGSSCSLVSPCSYDTACNASSSGDRILYMDGIYNRNGTFLTCSSGVTHRGINRHLAILRNTNTSQSFGNDEFRIGHSNTTLERVTIDGQVTASSGDGAGGVVIRGASNVIVQDVVIQNTGSSCLFLDNNHNNNIIRHNQLSGCGYTKQLSPGSFGRECFHLGGYTGQTATNIQLYGNTCYDYGAEGIDAKSNVIGAEIHHNVFSLLRNADAFGNWMRLEGQNYDVYKNVGKDSPNTTSSMITIAEDANINVHDNTFYNFDSSAHIVSAFDRNQAQSFFQDNTLCNTSSTVQFGSGVTSQNNLFNQSQSVCDAAETAILAEIPGLPGYPAAPPPVANNYGPSLEPCHTTVTDPGAITLNRNQSWASTINAGGSGQVYLLDSSQGTFSSGTTLEWKNVKVYPENCDAVKLDLSQTMELGSNTVVAGLELDFADAPGCVRMDDDLISSETLVTGAVLRNNKIYGGLSGNCVAIQSNATNNTIEGNEINGGGTSGLNVAIRGDGRFDSCDGSSPADNVVRNNYLHKTESQIPGWSSSNFSGTEDLFGSVASDDFLFEGNRLGRVPSGQEEQIDDKYKCNGGVGLFIRNYSDGRQHLPATKACWLFQTEDGPFSPAVRNDVVLIGNIFDQCDKLDSNKEAVVIGAKTPDLFGGGMWYNIANHVFDVEAIGLRDTLNTFDFRHNLVFNGGINFESGGNPSQADEFDEFKDNILSSAPWINGGNAVITSCSHNVSHSTTGSIPSECTDTISTNPVFANPVLCTELGLCDFTPTSASFVSQVGSDGAVRGPVVPPVIAGAVVENATPSRVDITVTLHSATGLGTGGWSWDAAPVSTVNLSAITCDGTPQSVCVAGTPRAINSYVISGGNVVQLSLAAPIGQSQIVKFDANYGAIQDSANFGNIRVNGRSLFVNDFSVTNNVGGGAPPGDILTGLIVHLTFDDTVADQMSNVFPTHQGGAQVYETGQVGNAVVLNGAKWVDLGVHSVLGTRLFPTSGNPFTIAHFHKSNGGSGTMAASSVEPTPDKDFQTSLSGSGRLDLTLRGVVTSSSDTSLGNNTWRHVAVTWDGNTAAYYIDGALVQSGIGVGTSPEDAEQRILAGARTQGQGFRFLGSLDEWRLYNRALLPQDISALANLTADTTPPSIPQNVALIPVSSTELLLSWDASEPGATYHLEVCQGIGCSVFFEFDTTQSTERLLFDLDSNSTYRARLRARDSFNNFSGYSAVVEATTLSGVSLQFMIKGGTLRPGTIR